MANAAWLRPKHQEKVPTFLGAEILADGAKAISLA